MSNRNQRSRKVWPFMVVMAVLAVLFSVPPQQATSAAQEAAACVAGPDPRVKWERQPHEASASELKSVFFINRDMGWAVGLGGTILKTDSGGKKDNEGVGGWEDQAPPEPPPNLMDVFFLDENHGWAVGLAGTVIRTFNGGSHWEKVEIPDSVDEDFRGVWFTDRDRGYIVGHDGIILRTNNGSMPAGEVSWDVKFVQGKSGIDYLDDVTFISDRVGYVSGPRGAILRTGDGGNGWESATVGGSSFVDGGPAAIGFAGPNEENGYAVGPAPSHIRRRATSLTEETWVPHTSCPAVSFNEIAFVGGTNCAGPTRCNGIAVGMGAEAGAIFGTFDGGLSWIGQDLPPDAGTPTLNSVAYPAPDAAYAVGHNGTIFRASIGLLPILTGISPPRGVSGGGAVVTITGKHLKGGASNGDTRVTFDGVPAEVLSVEDGVVKAVAPPHPAGTAQVRVVTPAGTSLPVQFEYVPSLVSGVDPNEGPVRGGTGVTIRGEGFTGSLAVRFGGQLAVGFTASADGRTIQATAPPPAGNAPGPVTVSVVNPFGASEAATAGADTFTYLELPSVKVVSPQLGPAFGGTAVTITGTGLEGATEVRFGDAAATTFSVDSPDRITAIVPPRAPGAVPVTVTTPRRGASTSSSAPLFTYHPGISGIFPPTGPTTGGTEVTIAGKGFAGTTEVRFGDQEVTFTERSDTELVAIAPSHAAAEAVPVRLVAAGLQSLPEDVVFTYGVVAGEGDGGNGGTGGGTLPDSTPPAQAAPPGGTGSPTPTPSLSATPSPAPSPSSLAGASPAPGTAPLPAASPSPGGASTQAPSSANAPVGAGLPPVAPAPVAAPGAAGAQGISGSGQGGLGSPDEEEPRHARRYAMSDASATLALGGAGATACFSWLALARRGAAWRRRASPAGRARPKGAY